MFTELPAFELLQHAVVVLQLSQLIPGLQLPPLGCCKPSTCLASGWMLLLLLPASLLLLLLLLPSAISCCLPLLNHLHAEPSMPRQVKPRLHTTDTAVLQQPRLLAANSTLPPLSCFSKQTKLFPNGGAKRTTETLCTSPLLLAS
jgi:hypothetical protein